ncbi:MAG: hypothetical protein LBQ66_14975 [Planctomycetaceae bacterium]|jgi:hypothetical protein|nr:hypothetical protein [Planctomycetaceae bacterium]
MSIVDYLLPKLADEGIKRLFDEVLNDLKRESSQWINNDIPENERPLDHMVYEQFCACILYSESPSEAKMSGVHDKLKKKIIPEVNEITDALFERWQSIRDTQPHPQVFLTIPEKKAVEYLQKLAKRFCGVFESKSEYLQRSIYETVRNQNDVDLPSIDGILLTGINKRCPNTLNPAALLNPHYEIVPFFAQHQKEIFAQLNDWCFNDKDSYANTLFYGGGGAGKTRLFIEWTKQLRSQGWIAGFLSLNSDDDEKTFNVLFSSDKNVFVAVDYAECREHLALLCKIAIENEKSERIIRIAFISRYPDWLCQFRNDSKEEENIIAHCNIIPIPPILVNTNIRFEIYRHAYSSFAKLLKGKDMMPDSIPDISDEKFSRILYLQMAALANLEELSYDANSLLQKIIDHEIIYWDNSFQKMFQKDRFVKMNFEDEAMQIMSAVTLRGGCNSLVELEQLRQQVASTIRKEHLRFFSWIYPGDENPEIRRYLYFLHLKFLLL